jgi:hypothetical protein
MLYERHSPGSVLNHVRWTDELAVRQAFALVLSTARASLAAVLPASTGLTMTALTPLTLARAPTTGTAATTALVHGPLCHSNCTLSRFTGGEVRLQTGREAGNRSIRTVSDRRCLRGIIVGFSKCFRRGIVTGIWAVEEVCRLVILC